MTPSRRSIINERPRPLALYYFGYDKAEQQRVLYETHVGGLCLNDILMHVAQEDLLFGGVGAPGMCQYHGREGFLTFSKAKSVFAKQRFNAAQPWFIRRMADGCRSWLIVSLSVKTTETDALHRFQL